VRKRDKSKGKKKKNPKKLLRDRNQKHCQREGLHREPWRFTGQANGGEKGGKRSIGVEKGTTHEKEISVEDRTERGVGQKKKMANEDTGVALAKLARSTGGRRKRRKILKKRVPGSGNDGGKSGPKY